jgi:HAD superfamily hydrolase (TIGR01549 family)
MPKAARPSVLRAVLFDWDGTLVDSAELSYRCFLRLFESLGIAFDRDAFARTYSPNWLVTYRAMGVPETAWPEADARWVAYYREERSDLIPGTREALAALAEHGKRLGLVTSGDRSRVHGELQRFGLEALFGAIVCGQDVRERKPHPEGLLRGLTTLGVGAAEAAYLGDSPEDIGMAQAASVFAVGIPGGFPNREALASSKPDLLASSLSEAVAGLLR